MASSVGNDALGTGLDSGHGSPSSSLSDAVAGFGDLSPEFSLRWHKGVNNFMIFLTGGIPVGVYDPNRLSDPDSAVLPGTHSINVAMNARTGPQPEERRLPKPKITGTTAIKSLS